MLQPNDNNVIQMPPQETVDNIINLFNQGQFKVVFEQTQILLKENPMISMYRNIMGVSAYKLEIHDTAIHAYKTAITLNPNSSETYFNMGITFTKQAKFNERVKDYQRS